MNDELATQPWKRDLLRMEKLRGFVFALAFVAAGVVIALRGEAWGFILVLVGVATAAWTSRWPSGESEAE